MSIEMMVLALDVQDIPPAEKLLLIGIANHADRHGGNAWPSMATLARYVGVGERQCQRLVRSLEKRGMVTVDVNGGGTGRTRSDCRPNLYGVTLGPPRGVSPSASRGDIAVSPEPSVTVLVNKETCSSGDERDPLFDRNFEEFWKMYPRKVGKPKAEQSLRALHRSFQGKGAQEDAPAVIATGLAKWVEYWNRERTELRFMPYPATWLNQRRWEDDPGPGEKPIAVDLTKVPVDMLKAWNEAERWMYEVKPAVEDHKAQILLALLRMRAWGYGLGETMIRLACALKYAPRLELLWDPKYLASDDHRVARFDGMPSATTHLAPEHRLTLVECMQRAYDRQRWGK